VPAFGYTVPAFGYTVPAFGYTVPAVFLGESKTLEKHVTYSSNYLRNYTELNHSEFSQIVSLWEIPSKVTAKFQGQDKKSILSCHKDGSIRIWSLGENFNDDTKVKLVLKLNSSISRCAISPEGTFIAVSSMLEVTLLKSLDDGSFEISQRLPPVSARVTALGFSPDEESLLVGASDGKIYRWLFQREQSVHSLSAKKRTLERYVSHSSVISSVVFHPFAKAFFSGDLGGAFNLWQTYDADIHGGVFDRNIFPGRYFTDTPTKFSSGLPAASAAIGGVVEASLDPKGEFLWIARTSGLIEVWRTRGMKKIAQLQAHKGLIYDLVVNGEDGSVYTVGRDGEIVHWRLTESHVDPVSLESTGEIVQIGRTSALGSQLLVIIKHGLFRASENGFIYPAMIN